MKKNILERAKAIEHRPKMKNVTSDEITLTLAWLKGEIVEAQIVKVLGMPSGRFTQRMGLIIKEAYNRNLIKICQ